MLAEQRSVEQDRELLERFVSEVDVIRFSDRLTIEAGTGESQSMDLLYLVEKP